MAIDRNLYRCRHSAKKDSFRPDLARLMQDAEAGKFDVIVVDKIDRFIVTSQVC